MPWEKSQPKSPVYISKQAVRHLASSYTQGLHLSSSKRASVLASKIWRFLLSLWLYGKFTASCAQELKVIGTFTFWVSFIPTPFRGDSLHVTLFRLSMVQHDSQNRSDWPQSVFGLNATCLPPRYHLAVELTQRTIPNSC